MKRILCILVVALSFGTWISAQLNCSGGCSAATPLAINTGLGATLPFGPTLQFTDPTIPTFAWQNQGTATVTNSGPTTSLTAAGAAGISVHSRLISAPATPYIINAAFLITFSPQTANINTVGGLVFRESATSKLVGCGITNAVPGYELQWLKYTNDTTFSANYNANTGSFSAAVVWLQVSDDGTNISCKWSTDDVNYTGFPLQTRGSFFTTAPNQVGFFLDNEGTATGIATVNILSWRQH